MRFSEQVWRKLGLYRPSSQLDVIDGYRNSVDHLCKLLLEGEQEVPSLSIQLIVSRNFLLYHLPHAEEFAIEARLHFQNQAVQIQGRNSGGGRYVGCDLVHLHLQLLLFGSDLVQIFLLHLPDDVFSGLGKLQLQLFLLFDELALHLLLSL